MKNESSPTMKDVAREAGLSLATVSKVINGLPTSQSSRQRVEAAIDKLGYHINTYARALKNNKTYSVILLMPSLKHPFFAHLADELTKCLTEHGYQALLKITNYDPDAEQTCFSLARKNTIDGVIALTYHPDLEVDESLPVVTIDRHLGDIIPCISSDNYRGGKMAAEKLIELGCRRLLFIQISSYTPGEPDKRKSGFESVCENSNAEYKALTFRDEDTDEPIYRFLEEHFSDSKQDYDGIFCNSDGLATRVIAFLKSRGVSIPEQVQIIGYDGIKNHFTNDYVCSTIEQPLEQMAQEAVHLLLNLNESSAGLNVCFPVKYISGGTTKD